MIGSKTDDNEWRMDNRKINNGGTDKIDNSRKGQRAVKKRTKEILDLLEQEYGTDYKCYLNHENAWQLLIATILSAQCTDARVNIVTKDLFQKYPAVSAFANADLKELEQDIHPTGFYHNKAKNIIACCRDLEVKFGGEVPGSLEDLTSLAGVGRKTANVIRGNIFHEPSVVVDTHVKRISKRLGLTKEEDPVKVEFDLMRELPKDRWILWNIHIIRLGRTICKAPTPNCAECFLQGVCIDYANREKAKKTVKKIPGKKKEAAKKTADEKKKAAGKTADKKEESSKEDGR